MGPFASNDTYRATCPALTTISPLPFQVDRALLGMIKHIESLYLQGKRTYVILTHESPDPDAVAGALGMKHLLHMILRDDVDIRLMLVGDVKGQGAFKGHFSPEPIENLVPLYADPSSERQTALVIVDTPTIRSPRVLPPSILNNRELLLPPEADIVLDHHNGAESSAPGVVRAKEAGSTSALILRALHMVTERRGLIPRQCRWHTDPALTLFINIGAWTDAGIPLSTWNRNASLPPVVKWVHEKTKSGVDQSQVEKFDLSACFDEFRVSVDKTRTVCGPVLIDGKLCNVVLAFAGIVKDPNQLGAFTSQYLTEQGEQSCHNIPMALAIFGIIRSDDPVQGEDDRVRYDEQVKLCIRSYGGVCSERIGRIISEASGGADMSAGATLRVPPALHAHDKDTFAGCCLRYLQGKLRGDPSLDWEQNPLVHAKAPTIDRK